MDICFDCLNVPCRCARNKHYKRVSNEHPDTTTNNFIYVRGEYDYLTKPTYAEIKRESAKFREIINGFRKQLGLE